MIFAEPLPFSEALAALRAKGLLPTDLSSADILQLDENLRNTSILSARTTKAEILQQIKDELERLLSPSLGIAAGDAPMTNIATARARIQDLFDRLGYDPEAGGFPGEHSLGIPPAERGSLRDLSSDDRVNLVLETNLRREANEAYRLAGQSDFALHAYPCYEMVRIWVRQVPRGSAKSRASGWPARWAQLGGQFYDGGRMIARKDDDIWREIGSSAQFSDAFDSEVPPFAFNSGFGWREVPRSECVAMGVIDADTDIEGRTSEREDAAEAAADFDLEFLKAVRGDLDIAIAAGRARLAGSSAAAQALGPALDLGSLLAANAYNPAQPRVPAGSAGGGEWTDGGAGGTGVAAPLESTRANPVSGAVDVEAQGEAGAAFHSALAAIDRVHDDGDLPRIAAVTTMKGTGEGEYHHHGFTAQDIDINGSKAGKEFTIAHEVGHLVDHQIFGEGGLEFGSEGHAAGKGELKALDAALKKSAPVKELSRMARGGKGPVGKHLKYLAEPKEVFARAYSQWIASKSGHEGMLKSLHSERAATFGAQKHWSDEQFAPISAAFEGVFSKRGWL